MFAVDLVTELHDVLFCLVGLYLTLFFCYIFSFTVRFKWDAHLDRDTRVTALDPDGKCMSF